MDLATRFSSGTDRDKQRQACIEHLYQVYEMLYRGPAMFSDVQVVNFKHHALCFLRHYTWLRWDANRRHVREWHMVIKFHYFKHLGSDVVSMNPSCGSCLADEDFVGAIATIASASTRGTKALLLATKLLRQYYRGLAVR